MLLLGGGPAVPEKGVRRVLMYGFILGLGVVWVCGWVRRIHRDDERERWRVYKGMVEGESPLDV